MKFGMANLAPILKYHGEIWSTFVVPNFAIPNFAYSYPPPPPPGMFLSGRGGGDSGWLRTCQCACERYALTLGWPWAWGCIFSPIRGNGRHCGVLEQNSSWHASGRVAVAEANHRWQTSGANPGPLAVFLVPHPGDLGCRTRAPFSLKPRESHHRSTFPAVSCQTSGRPWSLQVA